jgi:hypothetical protein
MLLTENNNQMENTANDQNKNNEMRITSKKQKKKRGLTVLKAHNTNI